MMKSDAHESGRRAYQAYRTSPGYVQLRSFWGLDGITADEFLRWYYPKSTAGALSADLKTKITTADEKAWRVGFDTEKLERVSK